MASCELILCTVTHAVFCDWWFCFVLLLLKQLDSQHAQRCGPSVCVCVCLLALGCSCRCTKQAVLSITTRRRCKQISDVGYGACLKQLMCVKEKVHTFRYLNTKFRHKYEC